VYIYQYLLGIAIRFGCRPRFQMHSSSGDALGGSATEWWTLHYAT